MNDLRRLLYEKERIGKVLELIKKDGLPDPQAEPDRALLYAHALYLYGDLPKALKVYYAVLPSANKDAERLCGLATTLLLMGNLDQAKLLLIESLEHHPSKWLLAHIYTTWFAIFLMEGNIEEASRAFEKGIEASELEPTLMRYWTVKANQGVIEAIQGRHEDALRSFGRAVKQLQAWDAVLTIGHHLVNVADVYEYLGDLPEAGRHLDRAEKFIRESGSMSRLAYLRIRQGEVWEKMERLEKAERCYEEAREILREFPIPEFEIVLGMNRASLSFVKGSVSEALRLIRNVEGLIREKGLTVYEDEAFFQEGRFLVRAGAVREGLEVLSRAAALAEERKKLGLLSAIALLQAFGLEELKQREGALERMTKCLVTTEASRSYQEVLNEREVLTPLLLRIGDRLPVTDTLSTLIVQLRHPALLKRLIRCEPPQGKVLFLRALKVHDARHLRPQLARLRNDPDKEVRRMARLIHQGWSQQTTYRVRTLGTLHVLLEGKLLDDRNWFRPVIKRLFLYFLTRPETWIEKEAILEALWGKAAPGENAGALKTAFSYLCKALEPWHLPDMYYVFFQSRRGAYGFFPRERFWMDYQEFERGIKKAEKDQLARNFKEARKAYREALDLYIGDYLEEFPYEDWLRPKRDYLRELYFRGVLRYATLEKDSGNLPEARRVLEEALFKDLSRCDCITLLIQTLALMKLTQQAKEWGQRHITYIKKELKEKPAPEVVEALKKLK